MSLSSSNPLEPQRYFKQPIDANHQSVNTENPDSPTAKIEGKSLDFICHSHDNILNSCETCSDKLILGFLNRKKSTSLIKKLKSEQDSIEKLKAELELLKHELSDLCTVNKIPPAFNNGDLLDDLLTKRLPKSLFSICETSEAALSFMMKLEVFPSSQKCNKCKIPMTLQGRGGLGFAFKCMTCKARRDYKAGTFWEKVNLQPNQILWFMVLYMVKARDIEISHIMEVSLAFVSALSTKIRRILAQEYLNGLPIFSGIVEIDVKNFIKRKIEIGKSKAKERWVMIIAERERKCIHMEPISEKKFSVIFPIIQQRVEVGTIIITENWGVYGRLEDYGYPHYKLDVSKGFAHVINPKIHISNVYGQWAWIKYAIKRYNRISHNLADHLNEFQWRRKMKLSLPKSKFLENMLGVGLKIVTRNRTEDMSDIVKIDP